MPQINQLWFRPSLVCLLLITCVSVRAQQAASPPAAPTSQVTVYFATYADDKSKISMDEIKHFGFYQAVSDPSMSNLLFEVLPQGSRPDLIPAPSVNALFYVERTEPSEAYAVSPRGVVWCGAHCYQLSKDDQRTVSDLIRHHIFTPEFWKNRVHFEKAMKFDDIMATDPINISHLNGKSVIVTVVIDENGKVLRPRLIQSCGNDELDEVAYEAMKHQKFSPVMENGEPKRARFVHTFVVNN